MTLLDPDLGAEGSRSINLGTSPGDGSHAQPYWYVVPRPEPAEDATLPELAGRGRWHRSGWTDAAARALLG